jgi:hypothetical protein
MPLYPTYLDGKARRLGEVSMRVARLARAGTIPSKPAVRNFGYSRRDPVLRLVAVVAETGIRTRRPRGSPPRVSRVGPMGVVPQQDGIWNGGHRGVSCFGQAGRHGRAPEILSGGLHSVTAALAGEILGTWFRFPFHSILPTKTGTFPGPSLGAALAAARIWNLDFRRSAERIGMCPNWRMCRAHTAWDFVPLACINHHGCPLGPSLAVWDRCLHEGYRLVWRAMPEFFLSEWLPHGSGVPSER